MTSPCVEAAADLVADAVQRRDHLADELAGLVEHLRLQRLVDLGEGRAGARRRAAAPSTAFSRKRTSSGRGW